MIMQFWLRFCYDSKVVVHVKFLVCLHLGGSSVWSQHTSSITVCKRVLLDITQVCNQDVQTTFCPSVYVDKK